MTRTSFLYVQSCFRYPPDPVVSVFTSEVKYTIYKDLSRERLIQTLPRRYVQALPPRVDEPATTVVFTVEVVTARIAGKAVLDLGRDRSGTFIFAAPAFSTDAQAVLRPFRPLLLTTRSEIVIWTDESYEAIKTRIGTQVKKPAL